MKHERVKKGNPVNNNKNTSLEVLIGGVTSILAIIVIVARCASRGFGYDSVLEGLVDFLQLLVGAMVFLVAIRGLWKPKESFEQVFNSEMNAWVLRSSPLIQQDEAFQNGRRYFMLTDHDHLMNVGKNLTEEGGVRRGQFVVLPAVYNKGNSIVFHLNKSTFLERAKAKERDVESEIGKLAARMSSCITANFCEIVKASADDLGRIDVTLRHDLASPEDARALVRLIEYVMMLYMAAA